MSYDTLMQFYDQLTEHTRSSIIHEYQRQWDKEYLSQHTEAYILYKLQM